MQLNLRHGVGHLGDAIDDFWNDFWAAPPQPVDYEPSPLPTTLTPTENYDPTVVFGDVSTGGGVRFNSDGSVTYTDPKSGASIALPAASALAQTAANLAKMLQTPSASGGCPAGYHFASGGSSIQLAPGIATTATGSGVCVPSTASSGQIVPGIENQTLVKVALGALALMVLVTMLSGGRRR